MVKFLRKRDPRFKKQQKEQDELSAANAGPKSQPAKVRAQAAEAYVEQEWQKADRLSSHADLEWGLVEGENDEEEWECVACTKSFRSEAAWNSHERSKKHLKEIERLRREMEEDDEEMELQEAIELDAKGGVVEDEENEDVSRPESPLGSNEEEEFHTPDPEETVIPEEKAVIMEDIPTVEEAAADKKEDEDEPTYDEKPTDKPKKASVPVEDDEELGMPLSRTERKALRRAKLDALSEQASGTQTPVDDSETPVPLKAAAQKRAKRNKAKAEANAEGVEPAPATVRPSSLFHDTCTMFN